MSIDFFVDPEAEEPYAGEVSVGCSSMPQVPRSSCLRCALVYVNLFHIGVALYSKPAAQPFCHSDAECGRGICSEDRACVCHANHVGDRCEFSILGAVALCF
jgi:hypothetical protein